MFTALETRSVSGNTFVLFVGEDTLAVNMGCVSSCFGGTQPGTETCRESKKILYFCGRLSSFHFNGAANINFCLSELVETKYY